MISNPIIQVKDLCQNLDENHFILNKINLTIGSGEFLALVGQNGAGKTTLAKHFNGLLKPTSGKVLVDNLNTKYVKVSELAQKVGYVFQNPDHQIFHNSVEKEISFGLKYLNLPAEEVKRRTDDALKAVGLVDYRYAHPYSLSRGQRQRVALASVLVLKPNVLVLDEPTTGLDYRESMQIMNMIRSLNNQGHTIIMITHDMSLVSTFAKRVVVLNKGEILLDGPVREVLSHQEILSETFLEIPPISRLADKLSVIGIPKNLLTVEEVYRALCDVRGAEK
ncbi:MAG: ATP-binding cassette domain-containing protein [Desulfotomaculum sp.]|nr:ATP-binding cassette domain-containing protein [Desulfotomaculum sp.]